MEVGKQGGRGQGGRKGWRREIKREGGGEGLWVERQGGK